MEEIQKLSEIRSSNEIAREGYFLQFYEWGEFQKSLGKIAHRVNLNNINIQIFEYKLPFGMSYLYIPRLAFKDINELKDIVKKAKEIGIKNRSVFIKIEPVFFNENIDEHDLTKISLKKVESSQPEMTLKIDLETHSEKILSKIEHDARYAIRTAKNRGVQVSIFSKAEEKKMIFEEFWDIFVETNLKHGISHYLKKYYEELLNINTPNLNSAVFLAKLGDKYISGAIVLFSKTEATYLYAASKSGYGKYNAPSLLIWEIIMESQKRGLKTFDLWGISNDKSDWRGLTSFKKSFGGYEVKYPGTFDLPIKRIYYWFYKALRNLKDK